MATTQTVETLLQESMVTVHCCLWVVSYEDSWQEGIHTLNVPKLNLSEFLNVLKNEYVRVKVVGYEEFVTDETIVEFVDGVQVV